MKIIHLQLERIREIFSEKNAILQNLDLVPQSNLLRLGRGKSLAEVYADKGQRYAPLSSPNFQQPSISTGRSTD